ncbi:hypothetical protein SAMN05216456_1345 [Devosia crocina]|uniref:Uncharacterized protein n=1 Tax=Devosia crocina TaxID=429728 RepID=A0A1I7N9Y8_9HYPH|nr:hypothetical protein [Devosia crocina]SFV31451.1 hypothetical protein SAMN05216456_1345 [Devosia crocina]
MTQLPFKRQTVDMETGKVTATDTVSFNILPPPADTCQECGVKHDPAQPHNAQSLHYQYSFYAKNDGRWPTWIDAMAHCSEEVREHWTAELTRLGVDVAGGKIAP